MVSFIPVHPRLGALAGHRYEARGNIPIWTTSDNFGQPLIATYQTPELAIKALQTANVNEILQAECHSVQVEHDPWLSGYADIRSIMKAGIPQWTIAEKHKSSEKGIICAEYKDRCNCLVYGRQPKPEDHLEPHQVTMPGDSIQIPRHILPQLPEHILSLTFSDLDKNVYIPGAERYDYIQEIQKMSRVYKEIVVWHDDPLWQDQLN